jgi:hypothetical protein
VHDICQHVHERRPWSGNEAFADDERKIACRGPITRFLSDRDSFNWTAWWSDLNSNLTGFASHTLSTGCEASELCAVAMGCSGGIAGVKIVPSSGRPTSGSLRAAVSIALR